MTAEKKLGRILRHLPKAIGFILLGILLANADLAAIALALRDLSAPVALAALPLTWLALFAKAERWRVILQDRGIHLSTRAAAILYLAGIFWGSVTPGRVGELVRIGYLTRRDVSAVSATSSVVLDRLIDLFSLAILAIYPVFQTWNTLAKDWNDIAIIIAVSCLLVFVAAIVAVRNIPYLADRTRVVRLRRFLGDVTRDALSLEISTWLRALLLTLLSWVLFMTSRLILAWALGLEPDPLLFLGAIAAAGLLSLLPITVQGIGTRDVALIALLAADNIPSEYAIALSTLILLIILVNTTLSWLVHTRLHQVSDQLK